MPPIYLAGSLITTAYLQQCQAGDRRGRVGVPSANSLLNVDILTNFQCKAYLVLQVDKDFLQLFEIHDSEDHGCQTRVRPALCIDVDVY